MFPRLERYVWNMGCDIHAHVETGYVGRDEKEVWCHLCEFRFGRNYTLFGLMAGVRRYSYLPDANKLEEALAKRGMKTLDDPFLSEAESAVIVQEASDTGVTYGQPSFVEKGIPRDIDWKTSGEYTLSVLDGEDDEEGEHTCTRSQADSWMKNGSSEPWDTTDNGKVIRITHPDWHTPSWLSTDEMETVATRFRLALEASIPEHKKVQEKNMEWAKKGLESALKDNDVGRIEMFKREIAREEKWASHDPLLSESLAKVEGLVAMMKRLEAGGRVKARVVFWFDN